MSERIGDWDRRKFLKRAGLSSVAVAAMGPLMARSAEAHGSRALNWRFMSVSGNTAGTDRFVMNGNGFVRHGRVWGGGAWNNNDTGGPPPQELLGFGKWRARRLLSLEMIGTYGAFAAGTIVMRVVLVPDGGGDVRWATLTMNCNIPPGALFTGLQEGFLLDIDGTDYEPVILPVAAGGGPPPAIAIGATVFNVL